VRDRVKQHHGIELEPEVKMLGEFWWVRDADRSDNWDSDTLPG
jgi:hypothetical protein